MILGKGRISTKYHEYRLRIAISRVRLRARSLSRANRINLAVPAQLLSFRLLKDSTGLNQCPLPPLSALWCTLDSPDELLIGLKHLVTGGAQGTFAM